MSGFATAISSKSGLKTGISVQYDAFFGVFTALPDLQIYFQTGINKKELEDLLYFPLMLVVRIGS